MGLEVKGKMAVGPERREAVKKGILLKLL